ncbi:hypothetical protein PR003_g25508 [Phytophthora rubi]|nr:hypothetical protein PR003_g25508 [Phytophthora rubi]
MQTASRGRRRTLSGSTTIAAEMGPFTSRGDCSETSRCTRHSSTLQCKPGIRFHGERERTPTGGRGLTIHKGEMQRVGGVFDGIRALAEQLDHSDRRVGEQAMFEGKRTVGVEVKPFKGPGGQVPTRLRAAKVVILSGGAINSPQLLMLSGVGDAQHLKEVGVPLAHQTRRTTWACTFMSRARS